MQVRPGPWDSPAVMSLSAMAVHSMEQTAPDGLRRAYNAGAAAGRADRCRSVARDPS